MASHFATVTKLEIVSINKAAVTKMATKFSLKALNGKLFRCNLSNLIFSREKWKNSALFTKTAKHYNNNVNNKTFNVLQHGFNWTTRRISHNNIIEEMTS